jgi:hypothetical protein
MPGREWGVMDFKEFSVANNGEVEGGNYNIFLHGTSKNNFRITPLFHVNFLKPGKLILSIGTVSQGGVLDVYVDDKLVWKKDLPSGPEKAAGEWKRIEYKKEWNIYWAHYDRDYEVEIPAGLHTIRLENTGIDWIEIEKITFTNCKSDAYADLRVLGLKRDGLALLWIQNKASNWYNTYQGFKVKPVRGASFDILDMPDGRYGIEWWDTHKGVIASAEEAEAREGKLPIRIPEITTDIACKVQKI